MFERLANRFVKGYPQVHNPSVQKDLLLFSSTLGILLNLFLVVTKVVFGLLAQSLAVVSDGLNNLSDTIGALVAALGALLSRRPSDHEHPFGHGRYEYVASFIVSFIIMYIAVELFRRGWQLFRQPEPMQTSWPVFITLVLSIIIKFWMYRYNTTINQQIQSTLNLSMAKDALGDVLATSGVLLSLLAYRFFYLNIDGLVGMGIGLFVGKTGLDLLLETVDLLLGKSPDEELVKTIDRLIMDGKWVQGYHDLVVHDYGRGNLLASAHVEIPGDRSVMEIHESIDAIEEKVKQETGVELVIHMDPIERKKSESPSEYQGISNNRFQQHTGSDNAHS